MSDLRVALVAEGPTDAIVIQAALKALLPGPFVLTQLQPEPTKPTLGTGWGGVLRWCVEFAARGHLQFEDDPTLPGFDLFVVHVDADVAEKGYGDLGPEMAELAVERGWPVLPNVVACPPPSGSAAVMQGCLLSWASMAQPGPKTALCVPSKAVEAWLAAATLDEKHALHVGLECNLNLEAQLKALPMALRIKKTARDYRAREGAVTASWDAVRRRCTQAELFSVAVAVVFQ